MQISSIQQTQNTNFKAKLQLTGNTSLLKNEQTQALKTIVDKIGSKTDIIDSNVYSELQNDCGKIRRVLISSINTTKEKYNL